MITENTIISDRYQLKKQLGVGGFSEVWLATDTMTGLDLAIKLYSGMDDYGVKQFSGELAKVFNLNHQNLLRPQHVAVWNNRPYLIMQYCSQGSCLNRIRKMSEKEIWRLIADVASGLAYLHSKEIVHQDIKPDNILITDNGDCMITDFGISTEARATLRKSVIGGISGGTTAYMAPERFSADPTPIKLSDIWSLGATVFEIMEGNPPFGDIGGGLELKGAEIPNFKSQYSKDLKNVVRKMLAEKPYDRPSAEELEQIAKDFLRGNNNEEQIQESPTPSSENTKYFFIASICISLILFIVILINPKKKSPTPISKEETKQTEIVITPSAVSAKSMIDLPDSYFGKKDGTLELLIAKAPSAPSQIKIKRGIIIDVDNLPLWCTQNHSGNTLKLSCEKNTSGVERSASIKIVTDQKKYTKITIVQEK
jgi:serine/threonine protein kinase